MNPKNIASKFKPTCKQALVILLTLQMSHVAMASLGNDDENYSSVSANSFNVNTAARLPVGSVIALNHDINLNGNIIPLGSEIVVGDGGSLSLVQANNQSEFAQDLIDLGITIDDLSDLDYTLLKQNQETGEIEDYNLPGDFDIAGKAVRRHRRSGVTNCYHVVKQLVRRRISLTGVAAYMAAPQLEAAGWKRYSNYKTAPKGSVCVFAAGGIATSSGGQIYGHVGVKGAGGIANPASGFHLKRPFLGCWNEK